MTSANPPVQSSIDLPQLVAICRRHGVVMIGIFGSHAQGSATPQSDLDLLVRFATPTSLLASITLAQELEAALGVPIDLLTEAELHPYVRPSILSSLRVVYEAP